MAEEKNSTPDIAFRVFLESTPPGKVVGINNFARQKEEGRSGYSGNYWSVNSPDLSMFCDSDVCSGIRIFSCIQDQTPLIKEASYFYLQYKCRNCGRSVKTFSLRMIECIPESINNVRTFRGTATKLGESPSFGPHVPARVITLIGPDRELFIAGRRSENQGLGIGAFAYYRRVVENQKNRLIGEIKRVAERTGANEEDLKRYDTAIAENQFSKAVQDIKSVLPQSLLINGQNPLMLLHSALSEGIHELPDNDCLELATSIRVVLTELAERVAQALKSETELAEAVKRLSKPKSSSS